MKVSLGELLHVNTYGDSGKEVLMEYAIATLYGDDVREVAYELRKNNGVLDRSFEYSKLFMSIVSYFDTGMAMNVVSCFSKVPKGKDDKKNAAKFIDICLDMYLVHTYKEELAKAAVSNKVCDTENIPCTFALLNHTLFDGVINNVEGAADFVIRFLLQMSNPDDVHMTSVLTVIGRWVTFVEDKQCDENYKDKKSLLRELTAANKRIEALEIGANMKNAPVVKEVKVRDDEVEKALYEELMLVQERKNYLEHKLAVYEATETPEEYAVLEELFEEKEQEISIDLSNYKLLIIGKDENKEAYPWDWVDVDGNPKAVARVAYADYVLFDARYNSHHSYWTVKQECKRKGVPLLHINNRNRDTIVTEVKRLIGRKEGIM